MQIPLRPMDYLAAVNGIVETITRNKKLARNSQQAMAGTTGI
jgi:hypothetical protein